ncbi:MAG: SRPBCC domain-containing protein [Pseudomonadota bacterium]
MKPTLKIVRIFTAPPELVFAVLTEPAHLRTWFAPEDMDVISYEGQAQQGENWRSVMANKQGQQYTSYGTYQELDPPRQIVMTHGWEGDIGAQGETVITITLTALEGSDSSPKTEMIFEQTGFANESLRDSHDEGWSSALGRIEGVLARLS